MTIRGLSCSQNIILSKQLTQEFFSTVGDGALIPYKRGDDDGGWFYTLQA